MKDARQSCKRWHYSRSVPVSRSSAIGVWESGVFIGAIVFSQGANRSMLSPYGLSQWEGCELARVALNHHRAPVSRIVSIAVRLIRKRSPGLRLICSYADPFHDHHGGIYQAMNWIYTGTTPASYLFKTPDGEVVHKRSVSRNGKVQNFSHVDNGYRFDQCQRIATPGKHRYVLPLDKEIRQLVESMKKPYPKQCAGSIDSDATGDQPVEGGADPTPALQPKT